MKLPPCDKRKLDRSTGVNMCRAIGWCYAIGCCEIGDMPCQCRVCLRSHGGKCPEGKDRQRKEAQNAEERKGREDRTAF